MNAVSGSLKGKTALIAGGAGKMGAQFCRALSDAGARVAVLDLPAAVRRARAARPRIPRVSYVACDVANERSVARAFKALRRTTKRLDLVISATMAKPEGYYRFFEAYPLETWRRVIDGNLTGAFLVCREAAALLGEGSSVIFVASIYGVVAPDHRIYESSWNAVNPYGGADPLSLPAANSASKAGLIGLAKHLSTLWAKKGVRVNVLTPGGVGDGQDPAFMRAYSERVPLGRMADWTDFNGAILYLGSEASRYVTGQNLIVDGGWTTW